MLFHVAKPKACSLKTFRKSKFYAFAQDGLDLRNGDEILIILSGHQHAEVARSFYAAWRKAPVAERVLLTRILHLYDVGTAAEVAVLFEAGMLQDAHFNDLLQAAATVHRYSFPSQIKNYLRSSV